MNIEKTTFGDWEAYRLTVGDAEMVVVTGVGPRIMSLRAGAGDNILFVDDTDIARGDWRIYGGHRLWVSPENEDCYAPDNEPCEVSAGDGVLTATAPVPALTGLKKEITISSRGDRFVVSHAVTNTAEMLYCGAIWALTCVAPRGVVVLPWGTGGEWDQKKVIFWSKWGGTHTSDVETNQWRPGNDLFRVHPTGEEGKMGTNPAEAWMALCRYDATFIKQYEHDAWLTYPDDNCSAEIYTCEHFVEMESLGPVMTLAPGEKMTHEEVWTITGETVNPGDGEGLRALLEGGQ